MKAAMRSRRSRGWSSWGRISGLGAFACATAYALAATATAADPREWPLVFTQIPAGTALEGAPTASGGMLRADYGEGGRIVRLDPDGSIRVLTPGFHSACGADVSFDGNRILFAAKRSAGDPWDIFEAKGDGTGVRQVTRDAGNCRSPAYQSTLYTLHAKEHASEYEGTVQDVDEATLSAIDEKSPWYQVMFTSDATRALDEYGSGTAPSLYSTRLDGSELRRLTFNLSGVGDPFLDADGRVLLASWQRADLRRGFRGRVQICGVNTDGTDFMYHGGAGMDGGRAGRSGGKRIQHMPCVTTGGLMVFVEADAVGWDGGGSLASVTVRRPLHSYRPIDADAGFLYHSPAPLPDGSVVVSRRPRSGGATHELGRLDPATGRWERILDAHDLHDIHARCLAPRPLPDGRSTVVSDDVPTGKLYCLDASLMAPDRLTHSKPGMVRKLRIVEGVPAGIAEASAELPPPARTGLAGPGSSDRGIPPVARKRIIGEVAVEADGSFHVEIPANVPVQLQTLDELGMAIETCGWTWAKNREPRGCIGCHEDAELAPENLLVDALKKPGARLVLPASRRRTVDFVRDIMPVIERKCSVPGCHDAEGPEPHLGSEALGPFNQAYVSLLAGAPASPDARGPIRGTYVDPGSARTSRLAWRLFGRNTSRPWDPDPGVAYGDGEEHPRGEHALTPMERLALIEWIDIGAAWKAPGAADGEARMEERAAP